MPSTISLRVGLPFWLDGIEALRPLLDEYRGVIEEVALFTSMTHPPLPLPVIEHHARQARPALAVLREMGLRAGINHLSTIGHLSENLENSLSEPWQRFVSSTGAIEPAVFCASDPHVTAYIRNCYIALAQAKPDFIWIDDDVRLEARLSPGQFCFCDLCMARYSAAQGRDWSRETLVAAFAQPDLEKRLATRREWLAHNRDYISRILCLIRDTVHEVDPEIGLGLMTCELAYSGYAFEEWANILGTNAKPAKFRPGGGYYTDERPTELLTKLQSVARQVASLPKAVSDIQYEHENFPYISLAKSKAVFRGEVAGAIASGCTGVALNMLPGLTNWKAEFGGWLDSVANARRFYDRAVDVFGRSPTRGLWSPYTRDNLAVQDIDGDWFAGSLWAGCHTPQQELALIGLPLAQTQAGASVTLLSGDGVLQFDEATLRRLFSGGVIVDGAALKRLAQMGLAHLAGFTIAAEIERDTLEVLTNDSLNGLGAGVVRDCRPSFWPQISYAIQPLEPGGRPLARLTNFVDADLGICEAICENPLGGQTAVMGYFPWSALRSLGKTEQMKNLVRWLSRETNPAYIASFHQAPIWVRTDAQGRPAVMAANMSLDPADDITVAINGIGEQAEVSRMDGSEAVIKRCATDGQYSLFDIGPLAPWEFCLLTAAPTPALRAHTDVFEGQIRSR